MVSGSKKQLNTIMRQGAALVADYERLDEPLVQRERALMANVIAAILKA